MPSPTMVACSCRLAMLTLPARRRRRRPARLQPPP